MTDPIREVHIHRADGHAVSGPVEPVLIRIEREQPPVPYSDPNFAARASATFQDDGSALAEAIWDTCPGGTIDALIAALLFKRASMFRVKFPQEVAQ
jgi:hypothetical protein